MSEPLVQDPRPERRPKLAERLVAELRSQVVSGRLVAGQKLPTESRLTETFGVSRTVVREALDRDPRNLAAIAGEGQALVEKGALEKAKGSLAKLESLCGASCPETQTLSATIAAGPPARVQTAEAVLPDANSPQAN